MTSADPSKLLRFAVGVLAAGSLSLIAPACGGDDANVPDATVGRDANSVSNDASALDANTTSDGATNSDDDASTTGNDATTTEDDASASDANVIITTPDSGPHYDAGVLIDGSIVDGGS